MKKISESYFRVALVGDVRLIEGKIGVGSRADEDYACIILTLQPVIGHIMAKPFTYTFFKENGSEYFEQLAKIEPTSTENKDDKTIKTYSLPHIKKAVESGVIDAWFLTLGTDQVIDGYETKMCKTVFDLEGVYMILDEDGKPQLKSDGLTPKTAMQWSQYTMCYREVTKQMSPITGKVINVYGEWASFMDAERQMRDDMLRLVSINHTIEPNDTDDAEDDIDEDIVE